MITSFTTSFGTLTSRPTVIVKTETADGVIGWAEAAALPFPFYKPETTDTCLLVLEKYIAPLVLNKQFTTIQEAVAFYQPIKGHNFAKTGFENALWMIMSQQQNQSIAQLLGGTQTDITVGESIGIHSTIEATIEEVQKALDTGFKRIKLKTKPGWDLELVKAVRSQFGDVDLMIDGNSAYTLEHVPLLKQLDQYHLTMIEQPLNDDDIIDHAVLQKQISTPVCLDESILSYDDARRAISIGACKIINIKQGRVGGLLESQKIHNLCQQHGIGVWCGGMLESSIGRAYNLAIASLANFIYPADMSPPNQFFSDDLTKDSFTVSSEGRITIPATAGLGFTVDEQKINHYTTTKLELH